MGAMASLLVVMLFARMSTPGTGSAAVMSAMGQIATWIFQPSLALTLITGLAAIGVTPGYHDAGWAWAKAATGILIFEGGFLYVLGPIQTAAKAGAGFLSARVLESERNTLWLLLAVCVANVVLGVWRPRFSRPLI
jgi:hypothetical protein